MTEIDFKGVLNKHIDRHEANERLGKWMSAALDDPNVCEEMKADIRFWFDSWSPTAEDVRGILKPGSKD